MNTHSRMIPAYEHAYPALVVGNYCHDTLIHPHGTYETLGGSASYISAIFTDLGVDHDVVANVGNDFKYSGNVSKPAKVLDDKPTTHFIDDYSNVSRVEILQAICGPVRASDIASRIGRRKAKVGLACGVAMEILPETLLKLRDLSDIVICDIQGLIRATDDSKKVFNIPFDKTPFVGVIGCVDYLKASVREAKLLKTELLPRSVRLLITDGPRGAFLVDETGETHLPGVPAEEVDSTGAGDCFLAGFAHGLIEGLDPREAARRGCLFGSLSVRQVGIPHFDRTALR